MAEQDVIEESTIKGVVKMDEKVGRSLVKIWIMALVLLRHLIFVSSCISRSRITPSATLI